jgi:putative endonuclease
MLLSLQPVLMVTCWVAVRIGKGLVVQSVRMPPCHGGGRGFESRPVRKDPAEMRGFLYFRDVPFYVYIIQSQVDKTYYKGFSENPVTRFLQHNSGESQYTSSRMPWQLVYVEKSLTKREALIREKALKKYSHSQIAGIINSAKNIVDTLM